MQFSIDIYIRKHILVQKRINIYISLVPLSLKSSLTKSLAGPCPCWINETNHQRNKTNQIVNINVLIYRSASPDWSKLLSSASFQVCAYFKWQFCFKGPGKQNMWNRAIDGSLVYLVHKLVNIMHIKVGLLEELGELGLANELGVRLLVGRDELRVECGVNK